MTENTRPDRRAATNMKGVDHTHPDTDRPFGEQVVFARGPTVAADGGARGESAADAEETVEETDEADEMRMKDVDHEAPDDSDANRVFERGTEGRDDAE